jgi:hypothetical protein
MGGGTLLVTNGLLQAQLDRSAFMTVLIFLLSDLAVFAFFVVRKRDGDVRRAMAFLRKPLAISVVIGLGQILPSCLLTALIMTTDMPGIDGIRDTAIALTGAFMLIGGVSQKILIVLGANFMRGISLHPRANN